MRYTYIGSDNVIRMIQNNKEDYEKTNEEQTSVPRIETPERKERGTEEDATASVEQVTFAVRTEEHSEERREDAREGDEKIIR